MRPEMSRSILIPVALSMVLLYGTDARLNHSWEAHYDATTPDGYYEFQATLDVYGFPLTEEQGSEATVRIYAWDHQSIPKVITIGWNVLPSEYGDSQTHFYTKWTNDWWKSTGCINMKCDGFQPEKGAKIGPGDVIDDVTIPKQKLKRNLNLKVIKDGPSGDWMVYCGIDQDPELIGRFPRSLFTGGLAEKATNIFFGGITEGDETNPPPMGSGYLPTGAGYAASMSNIQLADQNGRFWPLKQDVSKFESNQTLYVVSPIVDGRFFYGGHQRRPST